MNFMSNDTPSSKWNHDWTCPLCTYVNKEMHLMCDMGCGAQRPQNAIFCNDMQQPCLQKPWMKKQKPCMDHYYSKQCAAAKCCYSHNYVIRPLIIYGLQVKVPQSLVDIIMKKGDAFSILIYKLSEKESLIKVLLTDEKDLDMVIQRIRQLGLINVKVVEHNRKHFVHDHDCLPDLIEDESEDELCLEENKSEDELCLEENSEDELRLEENKSEDEFCFKENKNSSVAAVAQPVHKLVMESGALRLRVELPQLATAADLDVLVGDQALSICAEGVYRLEMQLPASVQREKARCRFDKKGRALTVTMPLRQ